MLPPAALIAERHDVTPATFVAEALPVGRPLVLRGLGRHLPIVAAARQGDRAFADYIGRFDTRRPVETIFGPPEIDGRFFYTDDLTGLNFVRRPAPISVAIAAMTQLKPGEGTIYVQSVPTPSALPGLDTDNPCAFVPSGVTPRIWIGNSLTVQTHFDLSQNLAMVVAGRRRFTLFPPDQVANLYVGPFEFTLAGPPVSMVRLENPDIEKYPRFADAWAQAQTAELEPGDAIYIPYFWWHHVQSLSPFNALLNYWWNDADAEQGSPFDAMLHTILALRDLPPAQRDAWRAMIDHFVFGEGQAAVEHLPEGARGALGAHTAEMRQRLWSNIATSAARLARRGAPPAAVSPPRRLPGK